ncbi:MAG: hypothetical protein K0S65_360 [Labilithrix sp.]|nr:hypothetical protein [Labilithrix sp.]
MKPLLEEGVLSEAADLLRSADLDVPPAAARRRDEVLAAIDAASPSAGMSVAGRQFASTLRTLRWGVPLVGVAVIVLVASSSRMAARSDARSNAPSNERESAPLPQVRSTPRPANLPSDGVRVEDLPSAQPAPQPTGLLPRVSGGAGAASSVVAEPNIDGEIAAIDAARGDLAAARPAEALSRVRSYRRTFAAPHFADEADVLEVQSLAALGRNAEARQMAERFLAKHPQSPYVQRVRSAVGLSHLPN